MSTLKINGVEHQIDADANMPLLWILRDLLAMTEPNLVAVRDFAALAQSI